MRLNDNRIADASALSDQARYFGTVCGECGGGPRLLDQKIELPSAQVGDEVAFEAVDLGGSRVTLTVPDNVNYADGVLRYSAPGTYVMTFSLPIADWYPVAYFSGTVSQVVTEAEAPQLGAGTPRVTGVPVVGRTLTAKPGAWSPGLIRKTYQWLRDGQAIVGATSAKYVPRSADRGTRLSVQVTGSKAGYPAVTVTSAQTQRVRSR